MSEDTAVMETSESNGAEPVVQTTGGVAMEMPSLGSDNGLKDRASFRDLIPTEYKDKEWVENIAKTEKPVDELFKQYENAQKLIGSRPPGLQIPGEGATQEQIKEFHKALGVSEDIQQYNLDPIQWDETEKQEGEYLASKVDANVFADVQKVAQEEGIPPKAFKKLAEAHLRSTLKHQKSYVSEVAKTEQQMNQDFDVLANQMFGHRKDAVIDIGSKLIKENVPEQIKPLLKELDSKSLVVLAAALDGIRGKYIREDRIGATNIVGTSDKESLRKKGQELMASKAWNDPLHADHERTKAEVKAIYKSVG